MSGRLPNFIWPNDPAPDPSGVARFGRVLHWACLLVAAGFAALFVAIALEDGVTSDSAPAFAVVAGFSAFFALAGRGLRYIFSGE